MPKSIGNIIVRGFSGVLDDIVMFRQRAGKTIVCKVPLKSTKERSEKMLAVSARFKSSIEYAKRAIKDKATKALYQAAAAPDQSAYNIACRDAFISPKVEAIDASAYHGIVGDTLTIIATDDFKVTDVSVSIHDASGALVEQGIAVVQENGDWVYHSTQSSATIAGSKITAVAKDLPGNTGSMEITL